MESAFTYNPGLTELSSTYCNAQGQEFLQHFKFTIKSLMQA